MSWQTTPIIIEAKSPAALADWLQNYRGPKVVVVATENGNPWCALDIDGEHLTYRPVFPRYLSVSDPTQTFRGDTMKRGQSGVVLNSHDPPPCCPGCHCSCCQNGDVVSPNPAGVALLLACLAMIGLAVSYIIDHAKPPKPPPLYPPLER